MSRRSRWRRVVSQGLADGVVLSISYVLAFYFRFNLQPEPRYLDLMNRTLPLVVFAGIIGLTLTRTYALMWRYFDLRDAVRLALGLGIGGALTAVVLVVTTGFLGYPRTVLPITWSLAVFGAVGMRVMGQVLFERRLQAKSGALESQKVLLVGAGRAGELFIRETRRDPEATYRIVGLVDDDEVKKGRDLLGLKVLGQIDDLPHLIHAHGIALVVLAAPSAPRSLARRVLAHANKAGVQIRTLPRIFEIVHDQVALSQLRAIQLEDLLGRDPVALDEQAVARFLGGRSIMVTGAGGSIGSEICRQLLRYGPAELILYERNEFALFQVDDGLRRSVTRTQLVPILGDVRDRQRLDEVMTIHRPQIVFHAAAYKHVPLVEANPFEALSNNVGGSMAAALAAQDHGVERFVLVSTDKAVNPSSFMGATKRIAERACQAVGERNDGTQFTTVRFGNVIGSSGSVVPIFRRQIEAGGPITVTHPEVERFFMTIPEAAQLVLQAGTLSDGSETFILEMGHPVRILDLAREMIRLSRRREGEDVEIQFTGLRPGEKLKEELLLSDEVFTATAHEKIHRVARTDQNADVVFQWVQKLLKAGQSRDLAKVGALTLELVPTYNPSASLRPTDVKPQS
ncbi:MAG: hypothetical protein CMH58_05250 [Myxococcales bacterium]|nr:hypothetical protein [Myxococcales bacterium]